jgi:hypothetical protein
MPTPKQQAAPAAVKAPSRARPEPEPPPKPDLEQYVEIGDTVEWYAGGMLSSPPWPGIVSQIGMDTSLNLNVVNANYQNMHLKDGVLHLSHRNAKADWNKSGGWKHRPITVAVRRLCLTLGLLAWQLKKNNEWELVCTSPETVAELLRGHAPAPTPENAPETVQPPAG